MDTDKNNGRGRINTLLGDLFVKGFPYLLATTLACAPSTAQDINGNNRTNQEQKKVEIQAPIPSIADDRLVITSIERVRNKIKLKKSK